MMEIDESALGSHGLDGIPAALQAITRSTRSAIDPDGRGVRLLGPDLGHHEADPDLAGGLRAFGVEAETDAGHYRSSERSFDLCFEDSWTGFFVAKALQDMPGNEDLVLIHLDDHTDMMSTLLVRRGETLIDPERDAPFDPADPADWEAAIASGAIGIGSFVTALFHLDHAVHVRHLNNFRTSLYRCYGVHAGRFAPRLLAGTALAAIRKTTKISADALGTYLGGDDAARVLLPLPGGRVVVHIDLDYLINDYNGNAGAVPAATLSRQRRAALRKIDRFFDALGRATARVDRWIVATSPGFCSIRHWRWLLDLIDERIVRSGLAARS